MRMLWYSRLYTGEKAQKHRFDVIQGIRDEKSLPWIYVITPASNPQNILDIYPADEMKNPAYEKREFFIIGIADGYQDALEVASQIVCEMYQATGKFCLEQFIPEVKDC